jgi:hypothetical protein
MARCNHHKPCGATVLSEPDESTIPIESQFVSKLADTLNAEIVLGTVHFTEAWLECKWDAIDGPEMEQQLSRVCASMPQRVWHVEHLLINTAVTQIQT